MSPPSDEGEALTAGTLETVLPAARSLVVAAVALNDYVITRTLVRLGAVGRQDNDRQG